MRKRIALWLVIAIFMGILSSCTGIDEKAPENITTEYLTKGYWVQSSFSIGWDPDVTETQKEEYREALAEEGITCDNDTKLLKEIGNLFISVYTIYLDFKESGIVITGTMLETSRLSETILHWTMDGNNITITGDGTEDASEVTYEDGKLIMSATTGGLCIEYGFTRKIDDYNKSAPDNLTTDYLTDGYWVLTDYISYWSETATEEEKELIRQEAKDEGMEFSNDSEMFSLICDLQGSDSYNQYMKFESDTAYSGTFDNSYSYVDTGSDVAYTLDGNTITITAYDISITISYASGELTLLQESQGIIIGYIFSKMSSIPPTQPPYDPDDPVTYEPVTTPSPSINKTVLMQGYWVETEFEYSWDPDVTEEEIESIRRSVSWDGYTFASDDDLMVYYIAETCSYHEYYVFYEDGTCDVGYYGEDGYTLFYRYPYSIRNDTVNIEREYWTQSLKYDADNNTFYYTEYCSGINLVRICHPYEGDPEINPIVTPVPLTTPSPSPSPTPEPTPEPTFAPGSYWISEPTVYYWNEDVTQEDKDEIRNIATENGFTINSDNDLLEWEAQGINDYTYYYYFAEDGTGIKGIIDSNVSYELATLTWYISDDLPNVIFYRASDTGGGLYNYSNDYLTCTSRFSCVTYEKRCYHAESIPESGGQFEPQIE